MAPLDCARSGTAASSAMTARSNISNLLKKKISGYFITVFGVAVSFL
jgi:hypothetical protein